MEKDMRMASPPEKKDYYPDNQLIIFLSLMQYLVDTVTPDSSVNIYRHTGET